MSRNSFYEQKLYGLADRIQENHVYAPFPYYFPACLRCATRPYGYGAGQARCNDGSTRSY